MITTTHEERDSFDETQHVTRDAGNLLTRKIWLPKLLYALLPYFYFAAGIAAFLATMYISEWFWVLPHYLLFSAACVHLGVFVYRRRRHAASDNA